MKSACFLAISIAILKTVAHPAHIYDEKPLGIQPSSPTPHLPSPLKFDLPTTWTPPHQHLSPSSTAYNFSSQYTLYVIQRGPGDPARYSAWAHDAANAAIGSMPAGLMIGATQSFDAGGGFLCLGSIPASDSGGDGDGDGVAGAEEKAKVVGSLEGLGMPAVGMWFDPRRNEGSSGCVFSKGAGETTFFECRFGCSPPGEE